MKKMIFLLSVFFILSCSDNENNYDELSRSKDNIGAIHNKGLDFIKSKVDFKKKSAPDEVAYISSEELLEMSLEYFNNIPGYENLSLSDEDKRVLASDLDEVRGDMTHEKIDHIWEEKMDNVSSIYELSSLEKNAISEFKSVFNVASSLQGEEQFDYINNEILRIKSKYKNSYNTSEILSGLIDIGLNSNDYWKNYSNEISMKSAIVEEIGENQKDAESPYVVIVRVDCLGYIIGWLGAVWKESTSPGGMKKENQWSRVGTGGISAVGFSARGLLSFEISPKDDEPEYIEDIEAPETAVLPDE